MTTKKTTPVAPVHEIVHTPGPWKYHDSGSIVMTADGQMSVADIRGFGRLEKDFGLSAAIKIMDKNGQLIASAGETAHLDTTSLASLTAGNIAAKSPAGEFLMKNGVTKEDFNSYGARRGNDRVMTRGTFANIRLRNLLAAGTEGGVTKHLPSGEVMSIYDASEKYKADRVPLVVLAGAEYGTGSSRDWAAKGTYLLGVRAVIAVSYERIHRSNLVGMGVLPLQFKPGESHESLGLTGEEVFEITGIADAKPRSEITVKAGDKTFKAICRLDNPVEIEYYRHGGILQAVLRGFLKGT